MPSAPERSVVSELHRRTRPGARERANGVSARGQWIGSVGVHLVLVTTWRVVCVRVFVREVVVSDSARRVGRGGCEEEDRRDRQAAAKRHHREGGWDRAEGGATDQAEAQAQAAVSILLCVRSAVRSGTVPPTPAHSTIGRHMDDTLPRMVSLCVCPPPLVAAMSSARLLAALSVPLGVDVAPLSHRRTHESAHPSDKRQQA